MFFLPKAPAAGTALPKQGWPSRRKQAVATLQIYDFPPCGKPLPSFFIRSSPAPPPAVTTISIAYSKARNPSGSNHITCRQAYGPSHHSLAPRKKACIPHWKNCIGSRWIYIGSKSIYIGRRFSYLPPTSNAILLPIHAAPYRLVLPCSQLQLQSFNLFIKIG